MTGSLRDLSVADLLDAVAARTSAPGGGAAAGTTTALAAALVAMAVRFGEPGPATERLVAEAEELRRRAAPLADDDAAAYGDYLRAVRAARDGSGAEDAVAAALSTAAEVPTRIAEVSLAVAELASRVLWAGNPRLRGDVATGAMLAAAACRAAALLVAENCGRDDPRVDGVATAAVRAEGHAEAAERLLGG